jgi:hypothetical protein
MLQYFDHFSIYHWFLLTVGIAMTTMGYLVKPDQPMTARSIAEMAKEPSSKNPAEPIIRDDIFYDGIFSDDLNGKGTITWPSRQVYRGDVRGGLPHGKGNMLFTNGRTYTGELNLGKLHGKGELHWPDGSFYRGQFINDVIAGQGVYTSAGGDRFKGEFADEKPHGRGTLSMSSGDIYLGDFRYGVIEGSGTLAFVDGSIYQGNLLPGACIAPASEPGLTATPARVSSRTTISMGTASLSSQTRSFLRVTLWAASPTGKGKENGLMGGSIGDTGMTAFARAAAP